jgi:co-chaperonin GroES (HSP10)
MSDAIQFKVGDKVRLKTVNADNHPEAFRGVMTVDSLSPALDGRVGVQGKGRVGAFFPAELERAEFRVGDRVIAPEYQGNGRTFDGTLTVDQVWEDGDLTCAGAEGILGVFAPHELQYAPEEIEEAQEVQAVEQEPEARPVTYRICVDNKIGTTEYPSVAAAEQAAILHGKDGETFSIWETVMVADYRVKVTKSVEIV